MKKTVRFAMLFGILSALFLTSFDADAQSRRRRAPRAEVVAWSADGSIVIFAEQNERSRDRRDLVARRVPNGEVIRRVRVFPGECAREIDGRVAIAHACALAQIRSRLPGRMSTLRYHVAANERNRITRITLRADGSIVEHELPTVGLMLRGRLEEVDDDETFAVLEVARLDRSDEGRVLDRRRVRPRAQRRWTLLMAGENHFIVVGRGVLRRIGRRQRPTPPSSDLARQRPANG